MAPRSAIPDPEFGAPTEQGSGAWHTSTVSLTTTASSPHVSAVDDNRYPPNVAQAQQEPGQLGESDLPGGSESLFSMYLDKAEDDDRKTAEGWIRDADGVLAFVSILPISPIPLCLI
jgi:hypothetical protein